MIEGTRRLDLSPTAAGFVLPLSLAVFKYSSPVWFVVATFFVARLYDIPIPPSHVIPMVLMAVMTRFPVRGGPSGAAGIARPGVRAARPPIESHRIVAC